jgi:hypothetical protein
VAAVLGVAAEEMAEAFLGLGSQEAGSQEAGSQEVGFQAAVFQAAVFREAGSQAVASPVADSLGKAHGEGLAGRTSTAFRDSADTAILGAPGVASRYPARSKRVRRISSSIIVRCDSR